MLLVRDAAKEEFARLGEMMVAVYQSVEGFPRRHEQPGYYEMLANVGRLTERPNTRLLVAIQGEEILGGVVYVSDMAQYGSGGTAGGEKNASGFRLLAVDPQARGRGVGRALVKRCIALASENRHGQVILHTTRAMTVAWAMYERIGFRRSPDLDFMQGELPVFGFRLRLD